jgi:hypothetical protein
MATLEQIRPLLWQALAQWPRTQTPITAQVGGIETRIRALAQAQGIPIEAFGDGDFQPRDNHLVRVALAELEHAGIVVYGHSLLQPELPWLQITEFGVACLDAGQVNPQDPGGYLERLDAEVAHLDPVVRAYVRESLLCWRQFCLMACAVTLGCASEQILLLLIDALHGAITDPARKQTFVKKAIKEWRAGAKFAAFRTEMQRVSALPIFPPALKEDLDLKLDGIHSLIRRARNDAGHHALAANLTQQDVHGALLLFPGYCKTAYRLIDFFQHNVV